MIKNLSIGGSNRTMLLLALVFGAVCAVLVGIYLSGLSSDDSSGGVSASTVPVVVVADGQSIAPQTLITADMLTVKDVPTDLVLTGGFTDVTQVVGKKAQVTLPAGQQVLTSNAIDASAAIEEFGDDTPLSIVIPEGKRAFAIYVSQVAAVGGLVRSGDHVDVIISSVTTTTNEAGQQSDKASACYAAQDLAVLAMGSVLVKPGADGDVSAIAATDANPDATAMTLAVTNAEAVQLAAAQQGVSSGSVKNELWVVLRGFGDHSPNTDLPTCPVNTTS